VLKPGKKPKQSRYGFDGGLERDSRRPRRWIHLQEACAMGISSRSFGFALPAAIVVWLGVLISAPVSAAAETAAVPHTIDLSGAVRDHFAKQRDYRSGDFITRGKVVEALATVERKTGWKLEKADRDALLKLAVDDKSFLAKQLTSKAGKDFARRISSMPLGYDKLDRLSELPQGRNTLERLVVGPDGYKLLEYMTSSSGGHQLSRMLSVDGQGNFERPTGKIYDDKQLTLALQQLHKAVLQRQATATRGSSKQRSGGL